MATYVLVHGGGHGGWCWQRLARRLRAAGQEVYTPTLTGLGERAHLVRPETDLETHIQDVTAVLQYEDLTDVILVGHSYGGMVITGVADRATARVGQLVYLDAAIPHDGESLVDIAPKFTAEIRLAGREVGGVELVLFPGPEGGRRWGVRDPDDLKWMEGKLTPQPWKTFAQPLRLTNEAAVKQIPRTNINATQRLRLLDPTQLDRALTADRVWEIDTGHDLMITAPRRSPRCSCGWRPCERARPAQLQVEREAARALVEPRAACCTGAVHRCLPLTQIIGVPGSSPSSIRPATW